HRHRPRPSHLTLIPSTTLFRSEELAAPIHPLENLLVLLVRPLPTEADEREVAWGAHLPAWLGLDPAFEELGEAHGFPDPGLQALDRKSTRLNSSHLGISYAVFC